MHESGAALGIYSMMESLGTTLAPMLYGVLLYRKGIFSYAVLMSSGCCREGANPSRRKPPNNG